MINPVVLLGGGAHGRVVLEAAQLAEVPVAGVIDPKLPPNSQLFGAPRLHEETLTGDESLTRHRFHVAFTDIAKRRTLRMDLETRGAVFAVICHPRAIVSPRAHLGPGCFVAAGAIVGPDAALARGVIVNTGAQIDHDCRIGDDCHIAPGVILAGGVRIGSGAFVASGAIVAPNISIGEGAVVGAGAVVLRDVPGGAMVYGMPATARERKR
ncbi:MAG: NeuD/PglB/VioB family sugar acetyltransferase [Alphaproteobacteria bacterium]